MSPAAALPTSKLTSTTVVFNGSTDSLLRSRHTTSGSIKLIPLRLILNFKPLNSANGIPLALGDELLLIGNNEKEEYTIKFGRITNLNVNKGDRHSSYIHTTFDRTGGSSGSPVWNTAGQVIAIHARGTDTSSFELPIDYLYDALELIRNKISIQRGEIWRRFRNSSPLAKPSSTLISQQLCAKR